MFNTPAVPAGDEEVSPLLSSYRHNRQGTLILSAKFGKNEKNNQCGYGHVLTAAWRQSAYLDLGELEGSAGSQANGNHFSANETELLL